jgi:hypothetical protein
LAESADKVVGDGFPEEGGGIGRRVRWMSAEGDESGGLGGSEDFVKRVFRVRTDDHATGGEAKRIGGEEHLGGDGHGGDGLK